MLDRLRYMAIWECEGCHETVRFPRHYAAHLGPYAVCPLCITPRLRRLNRPDMIDRRHTGLFNLLERLAGGCLYHCRYCRLQFWDRRPLASEVAGLEPQPQPQPQPAEAATIQPGTARLGE
jgi:hypothetical protein